MPDARAKLTRFLEELKRRRVWQAAAGYAVVAWVLLQLAETTFEPLHFPDWMWTAWVVLVIAGFPVVLALSWFLNLTLKGFKRDAGARSATGEPTQDRAREPSVAVLAFEDMSAEKDQDYLCDGIAEEILNRLAQIKSLGVASRTSSFRFKGQPADVATIGEQLKVATVLEGSVRKLGNHLRITTQLIDVANGYHLWSQRYDRELEDIFEIQDEIAAQVAAALEVTLSGSTEEDPGTSDAKAYDRYLKGWHYFNRWGLRNVEFAIEMFGKAVDRDPTYARAWAALSDSHAMVCMYWDATADHLEATERASDKALELAPDLAESHVSRGLSHVVHDRFDAAVAEFEIALELDPDSFSAYYYYARISFSRGELERAAELFERAESKRPEDFQAPILLRQIYRSLGRDADALAAARRGLERARAHLELNPDDTRALNLGLGGLADLGLDDELVAWARRSLALDGDNADTLYNIACGYARVGRTEQAMDTLERACLCGLSIADWAESDSDLASVHGHPRFLALMERIRSR